MRLFCLLFVILTAASPALADGELTANWAENYIKQNHPNLMLGSESDHVMSVYYFGKHKNRRLMGLERVRGDDYEQFFTILVFENKRLLGYYENILSFPSTISKDGVVGFPFGISGNIKETRQPLKLGSNVFGDLCQTQSQITKCYSWQPANYKSLK